jgi:hypothetical protein
MLGLTVPARQAPYTTGQHDTVSARIGSLTNGCDAVQDPRKGHGSAAARVSEANSRRNL